jgi:hypothetical protein
MPIIHFLGKISPSTAYQVSMHDLPGMTFTPADKSFTTTLSILVKDSAVDVECSTDKFNAAIMEQIHKLAYDYARATSNFFSFATGISLSVVFDEFIDPSGVRTPFVIQHLDLAPICTAFRMNDEVLPTSLSRVMSIAFTEPALWLALDDLITATTVHSLVVVNSARAIEGLRHAMAPPGMSRNEAWELFRTNLRVTKDYLELIIDTSKSGRHGDPTFIPGTVTTEITRRSRTIMNRFFEFRLRNNQPLDAADFELLER